MKKLLLAFMATWPVIAVCAQTYITPVRSDLTPPNPQSAVPVAVQTPEPDMVTGAVNVNIPLYTIVSDGYSLPVSLTYHSNGIKVEDDPAPLGYGWMLQPALRVVRTVHGRPDEQYPMVEDHQFGNDEQGMAYMCAVRPNAFSINNTDRYDAMGRCVAVSEPGADVSEESNWTLTQYSADSRGQVVSTLRSGQAWHSSDRKARVRYLVNEASGTLACPKLEVSAGGGLSLNGFYDAGTLSVTETTDEDGIKRRVYTDGGNRQVMMQAVDGDQVLNTRYVYDDYGRLRFILPPDFEDGDASVTDADFTTRCHEMRYDTRGRLVWTRTPGATKGAEQRWSAGGRVVARQHAGMAEDNWIVQFYDRCGRPAYSCNSYLVGSEETELSTSFPVAEYTGNAEFCGYAINPQPEYNIDNAWRVEYYDDYQYLTLSDMPTVDFAAGPARGLPTGSLDYPSGTVRVYGYDAWGREVNSVLSTQGAVLRVQTAYDRAGARLSVSEQLEWRGRTYTRSTANTYDAAGRLTKTEVSTGGAVRGWQIYGYDAAGRLATVKCGNNVRRTRTYDVHGWPVRTVTQVPRFQALDTAEISLPFYRAAVGAGIVPMSRYTDYTETLYYAEGGAPRYGGVPSALQTALGGRYDYAYDGFDRLVEAAYTAAEGAAEGEDFSAAYTYTPTSAPLTVQRSGVVDVAVGAEAAETFGTLDHLTYTWDGARLQSVESESHGSDYLGRPGYATSWYGDVTAYEWNAAGQLTKDASRNISRINYAACGLPQQVSMTNGDYVSYVRATDGALLGVSTYQKLGGRRPVRTARRVYVGDWELDSDTVTLVRCPWGWIDAAGRASYEHRDTRGSVTMVTDHHGSVSMHTGYYPDGEPWRTPAGRSRQLEGKERLTALGLNEYLYPGRHYAAATALFTTPDPLAAEFGWVNPYSYCAANPNRFTDPTGMASVYQKKKQELVKIFDDGNDNDPSKYIADKKLAKKLTSLKSDQKYILSEKDKQHLALLPTNSDLEEFEKLKLEATELQVETGMHKTADGNLHKWDNGMQVRDDGETSELSIQPFRANGKRIQNDSQILYYMHVHPCLKRNSAHGESIPSSADIAYDKYLRSSGFNFTAIIYGAKHSTITFYHKSKTIETIPISALKKIWTE